MPGFVLEKYVTPIFNWGNRDFKKGEGEIVGLGT